MIRSCLKQNYLLIAMVFVLELDFNIGLRPEFPTRSDLHLYLTAMTRVMSYCQQTKAKQVINVLRPGLFLLNVNLRHASLTPGIQRAVKQSLELGIQFNNQQLRYYHNVLGQTGGGRLFSNLEVWTKEVERLPKYKRVTFTSRANLQKKYSSWNVYSNRLNSQLTHHASARLVNCMLALDINRIQASGSPYKCSLPQECLVFLLNSWNEGPLLLIKLWTLLVARMGVRCYVFSPQKDKELTTKFCADMFEEAQYNAYNGYRQLELMAHQVGVCSLFGHVEFLQRAWLNAMVKNQGPSGCFLNANRCEEFVTSGVMRALGAVIRFLVTP